MIFEEKHQNSVFSLFDIFGKKGKNAKNWEK
jgi:hypothetical protein